MANWRDRSDKFTSGRKKNVYVPHDYSKDRWFLPNRLILALTIFISLCIFTLLYLYVELNSVRRDLEAALTDKGHLSLVLESLQLQCDDSAKRDGKSWSRYKLCDGLSKEHPSFLLFQ